MVLGTAQIGLPYGIANKIGPPNERDAVALIRRAVDAGHEYRHRAHLWPRGSAYRQGVAWRLWRHNCDET
jgi:hypothetical protein